MNQNPEQLARDQIELKLYASGWVIQKKNAVNLTAAAVIAIREYQANIGLADYVLFVDKKTVGKIEAKHAEKSVHLTVLEDQSEGYISAKMKYLNNEKLPFFYESLRDFTRFTDYRDPKPRFRQVLSFHCPETFREWFKQEIALQSQKRKEK